MWKRRYWKGNNAICGLSLLFALSFALRGFSPGTPVFPSPQKPTFPNSSSARNQVDDWEPLYGCATSKSLFTILFKLEIEPYGIEFVFFFSCPFSFLSCCRLIIHDIFLYIPSYYNSLVTLWHQFGSVVVIFGIILRNAVPHLRGDHAAKRLLLHWYM